MKFGILTVSIIGQPSVEIPFVHVARMVSKHPVVSSVGYDPPIVGRVGVARNRKHGKFTPASPFIVGIVCVISVEIYHAQSIMRCPGRISRLG